MVLVIDKLRWFKEWFKAQWHGVIMWKHFETWCVRRYIKTDYVLGTISCKFSSNIATFYNHAKIRQVTAVKLLLCEYHFLKTNCIHQACMYVFRHVWVNVNNKYWLLLSCLTSLILTLVYRLEGQSFWPQTMKKVFDKKGAPKKCVFCLINISWRQTKAAAFVPLHGWCLAPLI